MWHFRIESENLPTNEQVMEVAQPELGRPIFGKVDDFSGEKNFEMVGEDWGVI